LPCCSAASATDWRAIPAAPVKRGNPTLSIDRDGESVMLFGGSLQDGKPGDTWLERSEDAAYRDEVCTGDGDLDLDGLAGCSDPDCAVVCP
jgi:hypothetical protein